LWLLVYFFFFVCVCEYVTFVSSKLCIVGLKHEQC
jgi:hypothetical protein